MPESLSKCFLGIKINFDPFTTHIVWEEASVYLNNYEVESILLPPNITIIVNILPCSEIGS